MKKNKLILALFLFTSLLIAQQKEKIKGSKIVTITQKEIGNFNSLEIEDNLEIFLIKGDACSLEIEADDNLHDLIEINLNASNLRLSVSKQVVGFKKFSVRVTYTDNFNLVFSKDEVNITALAEIKLDNITFKTNDFSKLYANVNCKKFTLMSNDKTKAEINLKAEETTIEMSKNAQLKALISSPQLKFDMYQKTSATIEGDALDLKLRLDNNADFTGKNLTVKNALITTESYTNCSLFVTVKAIIEASGKSEIQLYGDQKIELKSFLDSAVLSKKPLK